MEEQIINTIKKQYSRELRKKLVKSMLKSEKSKDQEALDSSYKVLNQIFSYIISELGWSISQNTNNWDDSPLKIVRTAFPKIETTRWFKEHQLQVTNATHSKESAKN